MKDWLVLLLVTLLVTDIQNKKAMPARVSTLFSRFPEQLLQVQGKQEPEEKPRPKIQAPRDKYRAWDQEAEEPRDKYKANKRQVQGEQEQEETRTKSQETRSKIYKSIQDAYF